MKWRINIDHTKTEWEEFNAEGGSEPFHRMFWGMIHRCSIGAIYKTCHWNDIDDARVDTLSAILIAPLFVNLILVLQHRKELLYDIHRSIKVDIYIAWNSLCVFIPIKWLGFAFSGIVYYCMQNPFWSTVYWRHPCRNSLGNSWNLTVFCHIHLQWYNIVCA